MLTSLLLILLGLALLVAGGEALLRGAVSLATILRMTPAVIGLTVVAAGTSVPELAVSAIAAWNGSTEISVANVVGSNIFNITFILGAAAFIRALVITGNTIRLEYPVLVLVTLMGVAVADDGAISRLDATLFLATYVGFTVYLIHIVRGQVMPEEGIGLQEEVAALTPKQRPALGKAVMLVVLGIGLLGGGAQALVSGAVDLARMLGMTERVIGLTIVAAGTGLPEVVTSIVSSYRGRDDVAIANVIGSNLFNILGILGLSALVAPIPVARDFVTFDGYWMLGVTLLLFPLMRTRGRIAKTEGALLLAAYGTYLILLLRR